MQFSNQFEILLLFFFDNGSVCICFLEFTQVSPHWWCWDGHKEQGWRCGCSERHGKLPRQPRWKRKSLHGEMRWKSEWKLSRLLLRPARCAAPLRTQRLHHKQLVGGEMLSASACGQIVSFFIFSLFLSVSISLFIEGDERLHWLGGQTAFVRSKARLCREEICRNNQIPPLLLLLSQWDFKLPLLWEVVEKHSWVTKLFINEEKQTTAWSSAAQQCTKTATWPKPKTKQKKTTHIA